MEGIIGKSLGAQMLVCFVKPDMRLGSIMADGVQLAVQHGSIVDVRHLAEHIPVTKSALTRTTHNDTCQQVMCS